MSINNNESSVQMGEAWAAHYRGQNDNALSAFERLANTAPDNIDVNFGYALCLKAAGRRASAAETFEKAKQLAQTQTSKEDDEGVRNRMILRMIDQHLVTLR
jgi:Flp pilus assembly protein TadD